jgi:PAS domain S-box-containing protein
LNAPGTPHRTRGYLVASAPAAKEWIAALGAAGGVAVTYYLAARLGLALLSTPSDVAVFWPASGIAAGILIAANRRVWPAMVVGVILGTVAANLMSDRHIWTSLFKGFCNAGEAVLVAGLIERWFGRPFAFDDLRRVLGFAAAACLGAAASALGGAATMTLFHTAAPYWDVWRAWFLSDGVGIVMVAPLVISLGQVWRKPPSRAESIEAIGVLSLVTLISWYAVTHPTGSWLSFDPDAVALPLLLWLVARCDLSFGIAGAFIVSLTVIYATIFGIGHFGDAAVPITERVSGAQVLITMVTLYTLVLAALFAECKQTEARLSDALEAGQVVAFETDAGTHRSQRSVNAESILGVVEDGYFLRQVHPDDRARFETYLRGLSPASPSYAAAFRFVRRDGGDHVWLEETARGEFNSTGRLMRIKGLTRDITERKQLEDHKNTLIPELDHRVKNVLATVSAIVVQTQNDNRSIADFVARVDNRIKSLAATHELLTHSRWHGVSLAEIVRRELAPYDTKNACIEGSDVTLKPEAVQATTMVLHELTTNAAKYGALSNFRGRVSVHWYRRSNGSSDDHLVIDWREAGGPSVNETPKSGYGTSVIRDLIPYELGGSVDYVLAPEGVCCSLEIPTTFLL